MEIERMNPPGRPVPTAYCNVVKVGNTVYIAGQTADDKDGKIVGVGDITAQTEQVLSNLRENLALVGATPSNIVHWTSYLAHREDIPGYWAVRSKFFGEGEGPAGATILVSGMAHPDMRIEIESIVVVL